MKITKFGHSCLLVEVPEPIRRTALFDPGIFSDVEEDFIKLLDYIIITHEHADHYDPKLLGALVAKFPKVQIIAPSTLASKLEGLPVNLEPVNGIKLFATKHEGHEPFIPPPENMGVHYLDKLTDPGDSHSFTQTKEILALPVTAPWGSTDRAVQLALQLKPKHILPIHDWHWKDEVRTQMYDRLEELFRPYDITFHKLVNGQPVVIDT